MRYLLTFRTYGTWLHGDERGSVDVQHNQVGEPLLRPHKGLQQAMRKTLRREPLVFNRQCRDCVTRTIYEVAAHRCWEVLTIAVQTNHVHLVIEADAKPEKVMSDLKAYATRRLRAENLVEQGAEVWSSHGSTRYLNTPESVTAACQYVAESQADLTDCP